jgi:DNA-binding beta-propeller fold protein YncE
MKRSLEFMVFAAALVMSACAEPPGKSPPPIGGGPTPGDDPGGMYGDGAGDNIPPTGLIAAKPSRSSAIAISDDQKLVVMSNPDDDSISVFKTGDRNRIATVKTGDEPWAIAMYPDSKTVFVANRADGTVVKVSGLDTINPQVVGSPVIVGSEPTGLALSPSGAKLFVAEFAQGRVSVLRTDTMQVIGTIDGPKNPRALLVTNDGDADDDDELLLVPEFFGEAVDGREGKDDGRTGRVRVYQVSDLKVTTPIVFQPIDSGFGVTTSPNQLYSIAVLGSRIYVTSVSASPEGPPKFDRNVFAVVYVGDLGTRTEVRGPGGTTNLTKAVVDFIPAPTATAPRFVLGDLVDLDFVSGKAVAYATSRAGDAVQRIEWGPDSIKLGGRQPQIDVFGDATTGACQNPIGTVATADATQLFVNCWVSRRLGVISLADQKLVATVESTPAPATAEERAVTRGKRFYFTGRGRWSAAEGNGAKGGEGWSTCGSCHPDGLSDGITWAFPAGPRQSIMQDASFSHGPGAQKQRVFNYSGIFDEHHDFEANVRNVSGGLGAITTANPLTNCGQVGLETPLALPPGLERPAKELNDTDPTSCKHKDWDEIDAFVRALRPPKGVRADAQSIARGRTQFLLGRCDQCHGGAGWTVSRRFFVPAAITMTDLRQESFVRPSFWPATWSYGAPLQIDAQPANIPSDDTGPASAATVAPLQVACALRNVGTFGIPGNLTATAAVEIKSPGVVAQGRGGFNAPSLYGLSVSAPYLHHGQARSLQELFSDTRWSNHTRAGFPNFFPQGQDLDDLVNFLLSIDATVAEVSTARDGAQSYDACPGAL